MKLKQFVLAGLAGGVAHFLLGWLFYGILFRDFFGDENPDMMYITLGCFAYGFFVSYIFVYWANFKTFVIGLKAGATFGLLFTLAADIFDAAEKAAVNYNMYIIDIAIMVVSTAIVGGVVAFVNGKLTTPAI